MTSFAKRAARYLLWMAVAAASDAMAMSCVIESAPQFVFGKYEPQSTVPLDVQTSFAIQCTPAYPGELLNLKISFAGISTSGLQMRNAATGELLNFAMYKDMAHSQPIDAQSVLSFATPLITTTTLALPVFGRIPARQNISVGNYQLGIAVILNF